MQELQENKEFIQLVSDHDIHTMIKAIRNVMGVAKIRKEEKSSKRKTGGAKRTASSKFDADTVSQLDAMMANSKELDRKSVVWGKSVHVRLDIGGRRLSKKKKKRENEKQETKEIM